MNLFTPAEAAANYAAASTAKAKLPCAKMVLLSVLAGVLIAFPGAVTNMATYALENNSAIRMISPLSSVGSARGMARSPYSPCG